MNTKFKPYLMASATMLGKKRTVSFVKHLSLVLFLWAFASGPAAAQTITQIIDATGDGGGNTLEGATGIAVDGSGNVFVTGIHSDNAFKITPGGVINKHLRSYTLQPLPQKPSPYSPYPKNLTPKGHYYE